MKLGYFVVNPNTVALNGSQLPWFYKTRLNILIDMDVININLFDYHMNFSMLPIFPYRDLPFQYLCYIEWCLKLILSSLKIVSGH